MIVVFNNESGDIIYTVEKKYDPSFIKKEEGQSIIVSDNEKIRANKYKVDLQDKKIIKTNNIEED